jgi:hypothetical protein
MSQKMVETYFSANVGNRATSPKTAKNLKVNIPKHKGSTVVKPSGGIKTRIIEDPR